LRLAYSWSMRKLPEEVREAAAVFGRMGGEAAGRKMSKEARIARARKAAQARWRKRGRQQTRTGIVRNDMGALEDGYKSKK
jgi:hypothetical protein